MSTPIEAATAALNRASKSLEDAENELIDWKRENKPLVTTHATYVELKAEVTRCTGVLERAQLNYDNTLAANRGKMFV
jgi:cell shape-determining protein MreC